MPGSTTCMSGSGFSESRNAIAQAAFGSRAGSGATSASLEDLAVTTYDPGMSDRAPFLSSGQGEAAATTVVGATASLTG